MSVNMLGAFLTAPLAGAAADRFGRRPRLIALALCADALCFWLLTRDTPFALFMLLRFFEGCAHIFALSLLLGLAANARAPDRRGTVMGVTGAGLLLGVALGAPLGGVLGAQDPLRPLHFGAGVLLATALLALLCLRETETRPARARPRFAEIRRALLQQKLLTAPLLFAFTDRFTVGFFTSTFPLFLRAEHALEPARIGALIAAFMLPFALLAAPFGAWAQRTSRAQLLCGGSALYGVLVVAIGFWPAAALPVAMAVTGTAAAVMFVPSLLLTTELAPPNARTTTLGAFNAAGSLGFILGPLTGGLVSAWVASTHGWLTGYRAAFLVAGLAEIALALCAFPILRKYEIGRRAPRCP